MEYLVKYLGNLPVPALVFILGLIFVNKVDKKFSKVPTWEQARETFKDANVCEVEKKAINEKLNCIPEMKERQIRMETDIKYLVGEKKNGT